MELRVGMTVYWEYKNDSQLILLENVCSLTLGILLKPSYNIYIKLKDNKLNRKLYKDWIEDKKYGTLVRIK